MTELLTGFTFNHADQPDRLSDTMTPAEVKAAFDSRAEELRVKVNAIISDANLDLNSYVNVKSYGVSSSSITTTGSIISGSKSLTVDSSDSFEIGHGISIAGAGAAGALLVSTVKGIQGTTVTIEDAASATVSAAYVMHDDTINLNKAFDAIGSEGGTIIIPLGTYRISSGLNIADNTEIFAFGAKILCGSNITMVSIGNECKVYGLEIEGAGNSAYDLAGVGIDFSGDITGSSDPYENYKYGLLLKDCYIHDISGFGFYGNHARDIMIDNCKFEHIGYAGIHCFSCSDVKVTNNTSVNDITPGRGDGVSYGITFNRLSESEDSETSLTDYPQSENCTVNNCSVTDVTNWEGIDTHAGINITFSNNIVQGCKVGIALVPDKANGSDIHAPKRCNVRGNTIVGIGTGAGISFVGADDSGPVDYATGVIEGNTLDNCGEDGNNNTGGMYIRTTRGLTINGNMMNECFANAICLFSYNIGFSVTGNTIIDTQDSSTTVPGGITLRQTNNNQGVISGNTILKINGSLNTYVGVRGIYIVQNSSCSVDFGPNNITFDTKQFGGNGQNYTYGVTNASTNGRLYFGSGSPEGVINAGIGSMYMNTSGGTSTTLYVKESGTSNTGWIAK